MTLLVLSLARLLTFPVTYVHTQTEEGQDLEKIQSYINQAYYSRYSIEKIL